MNQFGQVSSNVSAAKNGQASRKFVASKNVKVEAKIFVDEFCSFKPVCERYRKHLVKLAEITAKLAENLLQPKTAKLAEILLQRKMVKLADVWLQQLFCRRLF